LPLDLTVSGIRTVSSIYSLSIPLSGLQMARDKLIKKSFEMFRSLYTDVIYLYQRETRKNKISHRAGRKGKGTSIDRLRELLSQNKKNQHKAT
jgi:hypothetical protein